MLYNRIGENYDHTRRADPYITGRIKHHLEIAPGKKYLELACGTGNYTAAISDPGMIMYAIDHSRVMLEAAKSKHKGIKWVLGDVETLPFADDFFECAVCTLSIPPLQTSEPAFQEAYRVLGSGRFVMFTSSPEQMQGYWLNHYFPRALEKSIEQMPRADHIICSLKAASFTNVYTEIYEIADALQDLFLYSGKHHTQMYLDPLIRAGISTFANLAGPGEVAAGCKKLENDINSGLVWGVINSYNHDQGDYLFVVAEKESI